MARKKSAALRYTAELPAPVVLASGTGRAADRIVEVAIASGVPVEVKAELAEELVKIRIGDVIPADLYTIAAILYSKIYKKK